MQRTPPPLESQGVMPDPRPGLVPGFPDLVGMVKHQRGGDLWYLVALPYQLHAANAAVVRFLREQERAVAGARSATAGRRFLSVGQAYPIWSAVDDFLTAAVRAQDALARITVSIFTQAASDVGLVKLVGDIEGGKLALPTEVADVLTDYWKDGGQTVRRYRVMAHHYTMIADYIIVYEDSDGATRISVRLTKPDDKRQAKFGRPGVQAQTFLLGRLEALLRTVATVLRLANDHLRPGGGKPIIFGLQPRGLISLDNLDGCAPLPERDYEAWIQAVMDDIRKLKA